MMTEANAMTAAAVLILFFFIGLKVRAVFLARVKAAAEAAAKPAALEPAANRFPVQAEDRIVGEVVAWDADTITIREGSPGPGYRPYRTIPRHGYRIVAQAKPAAPTQDYA